MSSVGHEWQPISTRLPFAAIQRVKVEAALGEEGKLTAKVHYTMRGDNELVLRLAFINRPKTNGRNSPSFSRFPTASAAK